MLAHSFLIPGKEGRGRQMSDFEGSLVYSMSFGTAGLHREAHVSKKPKYKNFKLCVEGGGGGGGWMGQ